MNVPVSSSRFVLKDRGRATVYWALLSFLVLQLGISLGISQSWSVRDPEFGRRLVSLRKKIQERGTGRPLVILLGSSRVAMNVRPGLMQVNQSDAPGPLVFNFGHCRAGPLLQYLCLKRLVDAGIRPDHVVAELHYRQFSRSTAEEQNLALERLNWSDVWTIHSEYQNPLQFHLDWLLSHSLPSYYLSTHLLIQKAPSLADVDSKKKLFEWNVDEWGWLDNPRLRDDGTLELLQKRREHYANMIPSFIKTSNNADLNAHARRTFRALADLCKAQRIHLTFLLTPDPFIVHYSVEAEEQLDRIHAEVARLCNAPVLDFRDAAVADEFFEGVHLTDVGAARFTATFEEQLLQHLATYPRDFDPSNFILRSSEEARRSLVEKEAHYRETQVTRFD